MDEEVVYLEGEEGDSRVGQSEEDMLVRRFLSSSKAQSRTLADIILEKLQEKEARAGEADGGRDVEAASASALPPKVVEVYTSVGQMLQHYKSGKLPKALKMLPHLRDWERVLWLTRPDLWSPVATYCVTRIFVSNLKAKMAQRFLNLVLLEKVRDDIDGHGKLNYHLYLALKKALFKPAAFYKGVLLPLAISGSCSLREATIVGSVLTKVSVPAIHSAAALLRLAEMPYCGSTSVFLKTLLAKKYALPLRVISALHGHFLGFLGEKRVLPVVWHQSLLVFVQRYKLELSATQKDELLQLLRLHSHHEISPEIRRELALAKA
ncbi:hypothetical protein EON64_10790 [archaeon]|nr:MAG: hypothetical protein EON64_10790 [archaeon]